jgi:hypothetical protein
MIIVIMYISFKGGKGGKNYTKIFCGGEKNTKISNPSENFVKKLPPFPPSILYNIIYTSQTIVVITSSHTKVS